MTKLSPQRLLPLLLTLFIGSGCSALIYEIIWLQLLQLIIGSSAVSLAVLLGTFMGGMCLGSLILPRLISTGQHPLRVYALLELGIGVCGLAVLFGLPYVQSLYTTGTAHGMPGMILRGAACAACLLAPTMMMGATLPAISRWIETTDRAASWWGFFYGGNIAGGVVGCLLAGFYLLRLFDMAVASYVAVAINFAVGGIGLAMARTTLYPNRAADSKTAPRVAGTGTVYLTIALSGLCALGAEVIWTRLLSLMLGPTVYTFSIILGVFLVGLGAGSSAGSLLAQSTKGPRFWLGICQLALAAAIAWAAFALADWLPYWQGNLNSPASPWVGFANDILRCACAVLPATLLWGASFPLALACVAGAPHGRSSQPGRDPGRLVGEVYAANTVGAIFGSLGFSLLLIPLAGTQESQRILILVAIAAAMLALFQYRNWKLVAAVSAALILAWGVPAIPWKLVGFGRRLPTTTELWDLLYMGEGMNSSVAYSLWDRRRTYFHVSGKVEASAEPQDMRLQRLLGHLPALLHPHPSSVLVVGCGAGVTAGTFVAHPDVDRITICEIEPLIPPASARFFSAENHNVMHDLRTSIVFDDARHYVLTTAEKYDIITSDPIHPWVKGIAPLYSTEYFELCKRHLKPGGFVTQWVPLYESNIETVKSEIATFFEAFPNGSIWGNLDIDGEGYDLVLLGQSDRLAISLDALEQKLQRPGYVRVRESLDEVGFGSAISLLATYAARALDLRDWLRNAEINRDRNLRLQYLAGMGLNRDQGGLIYRQIMSFGAFPGEMFTGTAQRQEALKAALRMMHR